MRKKMKYDIPKRVISVSKYYEFNSMNAKYKNSDPPSHSTIKNIVSNFEKKRAQLLTYLQSGKFQAQNAKSPKLSWKRWSQNFHPC